MEPGEFRKRVILKALIAPTVLFPALFGATAAAVGVAAGDFLGFMGFLGVTGVLWGVGAGLTRLLLSSRKLGEQVLEEAETGRRDAALARLKQVERRLEKTRDPRTFAVIRALRHQRHRLFDAVENHAFPVPPEIAGMSQQLYDQCVDSLDRSATLWETARKMATKQAREELMAKREAMLEEVRRGVEQWALTLDRLQAAPIERGDTAEAVARIREELDQELAVARRVDERMTALERDINPDPLARERERA